MARSTPPLKDTQLKQAKPREKEYNLADGDGLMLRIKPNGTKIWIFNYIRPYVKKRTNISLGEYPSMSLAEARCKRSEYRSCLANQIDPLSQRKNLEKKAQQEIENTFLVLAEKWIEWKRPTVQKETADTAWLRLNKHILPTLGNFPIHQLEIADIERTLLPLVREGKLETVQRLCGLIREVMQFAVVRRVISHNHLADIAKLFPNPKVRHAPTIDSDELPQFLKSLVEAKIQLPTRHLILWQLYTMTRPNEAATARWDEIDKERLVWIIPADKMKMQNAHTVFLSEQMMKLLLSIEECGTKREYLFPGHRNPRNHISSQTANMAIKRMGYKGRLVAHGLRALASTTLYESGLFRSEVIEHSLAHVEKNSVKAAYNRARYEGERRKLTAWWSDHIQRALMSTNADFANVYGTKLRLVK